MQQKSAKMDHYIAIKNSLGLGQCKANVSRYMTTGLLEIVIHALLMGVLATVILDAWAQLLKFSVNVQPTNWALVGRWFASLFTGHWRHAAISQVPAVNNERLLGWSFHYGVGIFYALIFLIGCNFSSVQISLPAAITFGIVTVLAPWLILQPGLGLGRFASNTAKPVTTRFLNIVSHSVFGAGLFVAWKLLN